ncbi:MAG: hypothetical protein JW722_03510 [Demequinaceae bacterium]|nr:hypothetical protein [Demequinaceae bacterium]
MTNRTRRALAPVAALAALLLAACGTSASIDWSASLPDRDPSAVGTLYSKGPADPTGPGAVVLFTLIVNVDEYPYFENARLSFDSRTVIRTATGEVLTLRELASGMRVEVWTDICAESFPIQCFVTDVYVTDVR